MATLAEMIAADNAKRAKAKQDNGGLLGALRNAGKVFNEGLLNPNQYNAPAANRLKDSAFGLLGVVPGVGDAASAAESADLFNRGENFAGGLAALGALPLVPSFAGMVKQGGKAADALVDVGKKTRQPTQYELAHQAAQRNAVDMLGLPPGNTWKDRQEAMPEFRIEMYRGFDTPEPHGNWFARTPADETQSYKAINRFYGPEDKLITAGVGKTYGERFTKDVVGLLRKEGSTKAADAVMKITGGEAVEHGQMIELLIKNVYGNLGRQQAEESALDLYNTLAKAKGFSGGTKEGGTVLLHPSTPRRVSGAAFDPAKKSSLNPLAGILGGSYLATQLLGNQDGEGKTQ